MFNVSIREYFSVLNVSIVCIRNTARSKSIPLLCTHVDSYKFSTVHPPRAEGREAVNFHQSNYKKSRVRPLGPSHYGQSLKVVAI
jgi:hypothetical protein